MRTWALSTSSQKTSSSDFIFLISLLWVEVFIFLVFSSYLSRSLILCLLNKFWLWFSLFHSHSIPLVYHYYYLFMLLHRINFIPVSIYLFQRVFVCWLVWVSAFFLFTSFDGGTTPMFSNSILNFYIQFLAYLFSLFVFTGVFFGLCIQVIWVFVLHLLVTRFAQFFFHFLQIFTEADTRQAKEQEEKVDTERDIDWSKEARPDQTKKKTQAKYIEMRAIKLTVCIKKIRNKCMKNIMKWTLTTTNTTSNNNNKNKRLQTTHKALMKIKEKFNTLLLLLLLLVWCSFTFISSAHILLFFFCEMRARFWYIANYSFERNEKPTNWHSYFECKRKYGRQKNQQ